jgi:hypothetical protein
VTEPLRMARMIDSLVDLTYDADLSQNQFAFAWERYVNRGESADAVGLTQSQKFDMDVILALDQFTDKLRTAFMTIYENGPDKAKVLQNTPARQPLTGRQLRRCAWQLNQLTPEEKSGENPEKVARTLLQRFYLSNLNDQDARKLEQAMTSWTSSRRI